MGSTCFLCPRSPSTKVKEWQEWCRYVREQRTRLYIMWRCAVILICWQEQC
ncbi:hypothetical protein Sjap_007771 [Stephania japonica]|uniref:DEVIL-like protein n=1 Tax=Stephania japonica TaxID=461633 RepID=A0AAP0JQL1_9MAGN